MALWGVSFKAEYLAWDGDLIDEDPALHTLRLKVDGVVQTATAKTGYKVDATYGKGKYYVVVTVAEAKLGSRIQVVGTSSTTGVVLFGDIYEIETIDDIMYKEALRQGYVDGKDAIAKWAETDAGRYTNLDAAYTAAAGNSPSATSRCKVFIPPWHYDTGSSTFAVDTDYVDLIALFPESGGHRQYSDVDLPAGNSLGFRPSRTLIYSTTQGVTVVDQSAQRVKAVGFSVAQLGDMDSSSYHAYYISAASNYGSSYDKMYFWHSAPSDTYSSHRTPIGCYQDFDGVWTDCIANAFAYRLGTTTTSGQFKARMTNCEGGYRSFIGDYTSVGKGDHKAFGCDLRKCNSIGAIDSVSGNRGESFAGCSTFANDIDKTCYFEDCRSDGRFSFGIGCLNEGTFVRCISGIASFGCGISIDYPGEFGGTAINCYAEGYSFGGGLYGKLTGTLIGVFSIDGVPVNFPIQCEGATIINSVITNKTVDSDCITLLDSNSSIHDSTLLVVEGGTGIPINAASAQSISAANNSYNNVSVATNGLGSNVTNVGTSDEVTTDAASREASKATGFATAGDIPTASEIGTDVAAKFQGVAYVVSPVSAEQNIDIVAGDDYLASNGRRFLWVNSSGNWANGDLTDATVTFVAEYRFGDGTDTIRREGTVVTPTGTQVIAAELPSADSSLFAFTGRQYKYSVIVEDASGYIETVVTGFISSKLPL